MASRGRSKSSNDSQLEFFRLSFGGLEPTLPASTPSEVGSPKNAELSNPTSETKSPPIDAATLPPVEEFIAAEPPSEILHNQNNFRITDSHRLGSGSLKSKCRANISAIELLKSLESE